MAEQKREIPWSRADRILHHLDEIDREIVDLRGDLDMLEVADLGALASPLREEVERRRQETDDRGRKLGTEVKTVEGISYRVRRTEKGSTVDTPCTCFGMPHRTHNNAHCPWLAQREERIQEGRD